MCPISKITKSYKSIHPTAQHTACIVQYVVWVAILWMIFWDLCKKYKLEYVIVHFASSDYVTIKMLYV